MICYFHLLQDKVVLFIFKSINSIFPSSIEGGGMEERGIGISPREPIYSGFDFPKVFFIFKKMVIFNEWPEVGVTAPHGFKSKRFRPHRGHIGQGKQKGAVVRLSPR